MEEGIQDGTHKRTAFIETAWSLQNKYEEFPRRVTATEISYGFVVMDLPCLLKRRGKGHCDNWNIDPIHSYIVSC
ncbi:hypothetical protein NPIL_103521 [Nephila pilipes]|uniref:Uncharacterized protein n=1 Tax=Nephila pilipes TaxID=299642 RepID=A0A8X6U9E5_NEPPI|nr:hypothetical protein NPIL_103521 [Nephila pilipes]